MAAHYPPDYSDRDDARADRLAEELDELEAWPTVPTWDADLQADPGVDEEVAMARLFVAFLGVLLAITIVAWLAGA